MQEYITGEAESWSLFDQLIKPIPGLVYPFLFSLCESGHLPPSMLNLANWKELLTKLPCKLACSPATAPEKEAC
jgi:hypothetical protein